MFESAKLKLERAQQHVRDLDAAFIAFIDSRPHRPRIKAEPEDDGNTWRVWIEIIEDRPLRPDLSLLLGDAIHNLRCVMDHLMWELIGIDGGTQNRKTKLPVGRSRIDFEASARGAITPVQATKDFLADLAIYPSGQGERLYAIHTLDNADKHTVLTPVLCFTELRDVLLIDSATGKRIESDPIYIGAVEVGGSASFEIPRGFGIDADNRIHATPDILFGKVDCVPGEPIIPTLAAFEYEVERLIEQFERFVGERL